MGLEHFHSRLKPPGSPQGFFPFVMMAPGRLGRRAHMGQRPKCRGKPGFLGRVLPIPSRSFPAGGRDMDSGERLDSPQKKCERPQAARLEN